MPSYQIISQDGDKNTVILTADDGYSETQTYVGDASVLEEATRHFNQERLASQLPPDKPAETEPVEVSDPASADLKVQLDSMNTKPMGLSMAE